MTSAAIPTLVIVAAAAVLAPLMSELTGRLHVPAIVIEIGLGIVIGPSALNVAHPNDVVNSLADMGLAYLMFLAGYELDLKRVKGAPLRLACTGWVTSLLIALGCAFALVSTHLALDTVVVGLALTTTALGTMLPVLRDAGVLDSRFGALILAVGTVGEFAPIAAVALLLDKRDPLLTSGLLVFFVLISVATALAAMKAHPPRIVALLHRHLHSSAQLAVRISVFVILLLVYLALQFSLDLLLGAFAAGIVVRLFVTGDDEPVISGKLDAIGFGFLVPIFFIVSGIRFDVRALESPSAVLRIPLFLGLMLLVRGTPAFVLYRRVLDRTERRSLALLSSTGLPLIVVITSIGTAEGRMLPENAAALTGAGMLSVLLFPLIGLAALRAHSPSSGPDPGVSAPSARPAGEEERGA